MLNIRRLIWDDWNVAHIARHEVIPEEVEEVCQGAHVTSETYSARIRVVGPSTTGRMLTVILAPRDQDTYYPVTARPASRKERQRYHQLQGDEIP